MITAEISRASEWDVDKAPTPNARREMRLVTRQCALKTLDEVRNHAYASRWFFSPDAVNQRETVNGTEVDVPQGTWLIDLESLEEAVEKWGRIVVDTSNVVGVKYVVTIYDDYIE